MRTIRNPLEPKLWAVDAIFLFVVVVWTVQLFLVITGLDAYLGGEDGILWPAAIASVVLAAVNLALVLLIRD